MRSDVGQVARDPAASIAQRGQRAVTAHPLQRGRPLCRRARVDHGHARNPGDSRSGKPENPWRAANWGDVRPPQLARLHAARLRREREARRRRAELYRGARFVQRLGGSAGREAYELVLGGLARPSNLNDCDPVVIAIDPEEAFCG